MMLDPIRKKLAGNGITGVVVASLLTANSAFAQFPVSSESAEALAAIEESVPGLLLETDSTADLKVVKSKRSTSLTTTAPETPGASASGRKTLEIKQKPLTIDVVGEFAEIPSAESGVVTLAAQTDDSIVIAQPIAGGLRILSVIPSETSDHEFRYDLNLPEDAMVKSEDDGSIAVSSATINGAFAPAWAYDAAGAEVETWYELDGHSLIQHISPSESAVYPIVADPAWGYSLIFEVSVSYLSAWQQLQRCFNCEFPVQGAPKKLPAIGKSMPLKVCFGPICGPFPVIHTSSYVSPPYRPGAVLTLTAAKGHVDGEGSIIKFGFWPKPGDGKRSHLRVNTWIKNNYGPLNAYYTAGAALTWRNFARNLSQP